MALSIKELENLSNLFLSKDDSNTQLAFEIMKPHGFVQELVTEIFVVFKLTRNKELKEYATQLLETHGSHSIKLAMARKLEFRTEKTIKKNISLYVNTSNQELNGLKFAQALYNKYDLGFAYLMKEGSSKEIKSILEQHINGSSFKLNQKGLTTMPKEFFEFTDLEDIDLSSNKISTISTKFKVFKKLRKLNVSNNCVKKIHDSLCSLEHLEELNLKNNLVEIFPNVIGKFKNLRRLYIQNMLNISGLVRGVQVPDNFFNLRLNHLIISSDLINGSKHGYEGLPYISTLEKQDSYIDLTPLAMAKQAFESGQKSAVYYLLFHAEPAYRKQVLAKFYDATTKSMNLSDMYIKFLPKELLEFDIQILNLKDSKFGYNFSLVGSADEGLEIIGQLKNLEELYLDKNGLNQIPIAIFNCTNLRKLSMADNRIDLLQPEIKNLQQLEYLNLNSHSWDPINFPNEIKELKQLKTLKINSLSHKTDEVKEQYIQRLAELFGDRVALNHYGSN